MSHRLRSNDTSRTIWCLGLGASVIACVLIALAGGQQRMKLLVEFVLVVHLAWYIWVVFGIFFTRGRRWLTACHIVSLVWGMYEQVSPWGCPLTHVEHFFQSKIAAYAYAGDLSFHYLDMLVNPKVPTALYLCGVFVVCGGSLLVYFVRMIRALNGTGRKLAVSFATVVVAFAGTLSLLQTLVHGASIADLLSYSVIPAIKGTDGSQTGIASFVGNFTTITTSDVVVGLVRQSDCSLSLMSGGYTLGSFSFTQTLLAANYEKVLHNNAGLTTTSNVFASGCASPNTGIGTLPVAFVGKTTAGINVFASISEDIITNANALYVMNMNTSGISIQDIPAANSLATADLNKDGNGDLVILNGVLTTAGSISVMLGKADGTFGSAVNYPIAGAGAVAAVIDDVNNDGILDIVVATDDQHISVLTGKGDGTFNSAVNFSAPLPGSSSPSSTPIRKIITADLNNDGKKDIICSNGLVLLGNGDGTFTPSPTVAFPFVSSNTGPRLASGDLNKDGKMDIVVGTGSTISIWLGKGDGTFNRGASYASIDNQGVVAVTDLDGDGNLDIYSGVGNGGYFGGDHASPATSYALMGNGDGTFVGAPLVPGTYNGTNLGDVNGDGVPDMLVPTTGTVSGQTAVFTVELGNTKGAFTPSSTITAPSTVTFSVSEFTSPVTESTANLAPTSYAVGDVNGDGKADVVYASNYRGYAVYGVALGNGDGTFAPVVIAGFPQIAAATGFDISTMIDNVHIGDFNHDGKADILFNFNDVAGPSATGLYSQGLGILPGNGNGTFGARILTYTYNSTTAPGNGGIPSVSIIGDFNGDGYPDLLASNTTFVVVSGVGVRTTTLQIYPGKIDGTFGAPSTAVNTTNIGQFAVADFNKDGKLDIAALTETVGSQAQLVIALGKGDGTFNTPAIFPLAGGDAIRSAGLSAADFDNDGNIDLTLIDANDFSGVFYGKGDGTFTSVPFNGYIIPKDLINIAIGANVGATSIAADFNKDGRPDILAGNTILFNLYGAAPKTQSGTTTALTASASSITPGASITLTATITPASGSTGTPTGIVTFVDGATTLGTGTLTAGTATFPTTALTALGAHTLTAIYGGDINFTSSTSSGITVTVTAPAPIATTTALSSSATAAVSGTNITLTAMVTPASGSAIPSGTVSFLDGATSLGTPTLDATGKATFSTSTLSVAAHSITAKYSGTAAFTTSTSSAVAVTITAPPSPDFGVTISPGSGSATKSAPATATVSVTPLNGFNSAVTFACSGLPSGVSCAFSPSSVTPSGATASTTTVTFTATTSAAIRPGSGLYHAPETAFALCIGAWMFARRRFQKLSLRPARLLLLLVGAALLNLAACGGPGSKTTNSNVTITATSGSLSHSTTYMLSSTN